MDEELIESITKESVEVETEEIIESAVNAEDLEQSVDIEETIESVETNPIEEIEIAVDESIGWTGGDSVRHYSLSGRDEQNQHPITAITGLRHELDEIESLKTVYSDENGVANYYEWYDGWHDEFGYFVSLVPHTSTITICDGADIFGVTVDIAGFVGRQNNDVPRNHQYGLVITSGLVDVRCESDVVEGDYVISNLYGIAKKTNSTCGYKVITKENKNGVDYASIVLGIQACTTNALDNKIQYLGGRIGDAEINIAAAMNTANEAYKKAGESISSNESMKTQLEDALVKVDEAVADIDNISEQVSNIAIISTQAKEIAESAAISAESARNEAVEKANEALSKAGEIETTVEPINNWEYTDPVTGETNTGATYFAEYVKNGLSTKAEMETVSQLDEENKLLIEKNAENYSQMLSSIDKYSIGEYSQAYGLTVQQAKNILKEGMVYIPTKNNGVNTHIETYADGDSVVDRSFTYGFYYTWTNETMWSEAIGEVWFGTAQPAGTTYTYWYDGEKLYIQNDGEWASVATLAGNVNNRITSMIRQDVNGITTEIVNARGSATSLSQRLSNTDATIASNAFWKNNDGSMYVATIQQKADGAGSNFVLSAYSVNTDDGTEQNVELKGASIVLNQGSEDSYIKIDADRIVLDGSVAFTIDDGGETKINGANIASGSVTAEQINADGITASNVNISGKITADSGSIGGCNIVDGNLQIDAAYITSGVLDKARIPYLSADQIDVNDIINVGDIATTDEITTITENTIQTTNVIAQNLCVNATNIKDKLTAQQINANDLTASGVSLTGAFSSTGVNDNTVDISDGYINLTQYWASCTTSQTVSSVWDSFSNGSIDISIGVNNSGVASAYMGCDSAMIYFTSSDAQLQGSWLGTSSIAITSDTNKKHDINDITDPYNIIFDNLIPRLYQYNDGTSGRVHIGFIAQEVENAITTAGKTTQDFAGFVRAKIIDPDTEEEEEVCCLRYEEFIALNTWQIQKLKAKISELEALIKERQEE